MLEGSTGRSAQVGSYAVLVELSAGGLEEMVNNVLVRAWLRYRNGSYSTCTMLAIRYSFSYLAFQIVTYMHNNPNPHTPALPPIPNLTSNLPPLSHLPLLSSLLTNSNPRDAKPQPFIPSRNYQTTINTCAWHDTAMVFLIRALR